MSAKKATVDDIEQELVAAQTPRQAVDAWFAGAAGRFSRFSSRVARRVERRFRPAACDHRCRQDLRGMARLHCKRAMQQDKQADAQDTKSAVSRVLWLTPMRALAADTMRALRRTVAALLPSWTPARAPATPTSSRTRAQNQIACRPCSSPRRKACRCCSARTDATPSVESLRHGGRRRMARIAGQQARRAGAARAGALAPLESAARGVGPVGHARQSAARRMHALLGGDAGRAGRRRNPEDLLVDTLLPAGSIALPVGRPPGPADAAPGHRRDRSQRHHAGLHQHPFAGRDLVPGTCWTRGPTGPV